MSTKQKRADSLPFLYTKKFRRQQEIELEKQKHIVNRLMQDKRFILSKEYLNDIEDVYLPTSHMNMVMTQVKSFEHMSSIGKDVPPPIKVEDIHFSTANRNVSKKDMFTPFTGGESIRGSTLENESMWKEKDWLN